MFCPLVVVSMYCLFLIFIFIFYYYYAVSLDLTQIMHSGTHNLLIIFYGLALHSVFFQAESPPKKSF